MSVRVCACVCGSAKRIYSQRTFINTLILFAIYLFWVIEINNWKNKKKWQQEEKNGAYFPCHSLHITSLCSPFLLLTRYSISLLLCFCFVPFIIIVIILVTLYGLAVSLFFRIIACSWFTVSNEPKTTLSVYFQLGALLLFLSICLAIFCSFSFETLDK